ncbi:hypothetical protein AGDE_03455 [Angomonas deanei]|uniref:Uncharacterized protein n=1 Tax=Angomonas deanei TaxID=59799 RepID=A0A7G2CAI0_9TRYP|nr:hypothetical protein AGDE_03455 [Angomonas deanei]CAD2215022.1 hypothetical protein, conserved [Angomonas deanei]|eukprot:EPY40473.1 hypothetical protein AGDE_03455 [Angomonas deanei]
MLRFSTRVALRRGGVVGMALTHSRCFKSTPKEEAGSSSLQSVDPQEPSGSVTVEVEEPQFHDFTPPYRGPNFPIPGRRGNISPEYYVSHSTAGHPDQVAELLAAGRSDPEWMWLKLLCFVCVMSTVGVWVYGVFFPDHIKYFKDEPWSPFRN